MASFALPSLNPERDMDGWLSRLTGMPSWALGMVVAVIVLGRIAWLYCLVSAVRTALRESDNERGKRALALVDKLLRWFPFRR